MASYTDTNLQSFLSRIIEYMLYWKNLYTGLDFTFVLKEVYFHVLVKFLQLFGVCPYYGTLDLRKYLQ